MSASAIDSGPAGRLLERLPPNLTGAIWGFAEATLFFVVPDVWLTFLARDRLRPGVVAAFAALGGAMVGGLLMMQLAAARPEPVTALVAAVPAVSAEQMTNVSIQLESHGAPAMLTGPLTGTPYKLYATLAPGAGVPVAEFLLWSIPARLVRFLLVTLVAHFVLRLLVARRLIRSRARFLGIFWLGFYAIFLTAMPW
ncbi:MAG TPA: hypothetical protein DCY13_07300 [Verrucomicrobiales bacterium]|nr:hypothetical protein [Verrucomicrobiales bacterium]